MKEERFDNHLKEQCQRICPEKKSVLKSCCHKWINKIYTRAGQQCGRAPVAECSVSADIFINEPSVC